MAQLSYTSLVSMREPFVILNNFQYFNTILTFTNTTAPLYTEQNLPLSPLFILCPHFALLHCYSILFITTLLNYIQYSLHRIYYLSNILHFNHLSIYFAVHLLFIFSYYCICPILYRGSVPCTGDVEPFVLVQNGLHLFIVIFIYVFQYHLKA